MQIEAGKFYKTRDGRKVRTYATDGAGNYPVHGAVFNTSGYRIECWSSNGKYHICNANSLDLISEWVETPEVDWSLYPKWWEYVAMDKDGEWYAFWGDEPTFAGRNWSPKGRAQSCNLIPSEYSPKFNGDAKNSLVKRPQ